MPGRLRRLRASLAPCRRPDQPSARASPLHQGTSLVGRVPADGNRGRARRSRRRRAELHAQEALPPRLRRRVRVLGGAAPRGVGVRSVRVGAGLALRVVGDLPAPVPRHSPQGFTASSSRSRSSPASSCSSSASSASTSAASTTRRRVGRTSSSPTSCEAGPTSSSKPAPALSMNSESGQWRAGDYFARCIYWVSADACRRVSLPSRIRAATRDRAQIPPAAARTDQHPCARQPPGATGHERQESPTRLEIARETGTRASDQRDAPRGG